MSKDSILLDMDAQHVLEIQGIWMNLLHLLLLTMVLFKFFNCKLFHD